MCMCVHVPEMYILITADVRRLIAEMTLCVCARARVCVLCDGSWLGRAVVAFSCRVRSVSGVISGLQTCYLAWKVSSSMGF